MVAGDADLLVEENRARLVRSLPPLDTQSGDWMYLLTRMQKQRLQVYKDHWLRIKHDGDPDFEQGPAIVVN